MRHRLFWLECAMNEIFKQSFGYMIYYNVKRIWNQYPDIKFNFVIILSFFKIFFLQKTELFYFHHRIIVYHNLTFLTCLCIVYLCVVNHHDQKSFAVLVFPYLKIVALANARNTFSMEKNEKLFDVNCSINSTLSL